MTDLHTHILPGMDDGAASAEESLAMLRMQWEQGVRRVALTPHFYPRRERVEEFLTRRDRAWQDLQRAMEALSGEERETLPALALGAEVAWQSGMGDWDELERLRIGADGPVLIELPFMPWSASLMRELYSLICRSEATVLLAHLDRYMRSQKKEHIREIYGMGVPIQLSADRLRGFFDRREILALLKQEKPFVLASDCHNTDTRPPCMGQAAKTLEKSLGAQGHAKILRRSDALFPPAAQSGM